MADKDQPQGRELAEVDDGEGHKNKRKAEKQTPEAKSPDKNKQKRRKITEEDNYDDELGINLSVGEMSSQLLVDYLAQRSKRFEPKLTMKETADQYIPQEAVVDTTSFRRPRATKNLGFFLKEFAGEGLSFAPKDNGSPHTLVIAGAALRATDLTRLLRGLQSGDAKVGKLFAKHIKLEEAKEFCEKNRYAPFLNLELPGLHSISMSLGVGTPKRISDLLDEGALSSKHLKSIIIDASYVNQKRQGILDIRETHLPLINLLSRSEFRKRYDGSDKDDRLKLLFY